jgi:hypothetical protein
MWKRKTLFSYYLQDASRRNQTGKCLLTNFMSFILLKFGKRVVRIVYTHVRASVCYCRGKEVLDIESIYHSFGAIKTTGQNFYTLEKKCISTVLAEIASILCWLCPCDGNSFLFLLFWGEGHGFELRVSRLLIVSPEVWLLSPWTKRTPKKADSAYGV